MTQKEIAEAYVREKLPELMELSFGCDVIVNLSEGGGQIATVVGKTPHQVHWSWARHHANKSSFTGSEMDGRYTVIGHPIQLQHWLRVLPNISRIERHTRNRACAYLYHGNEKWTKIMFSLETGQPAGEENYKAFNDIVGI